MKERLIVNVSSKHLILRIILFAAAFILAVYSFTRAVASIGHKEPGWHEASASADSETPFYAGDIKAYIYLEGSSSQIRRTLASFSTEYSNAMKRVYRIFDSVNQYEDYVNLATVNASLGKKFIVPRDLFDVLYDAYSKTLNGTENLFAGALYTAQKAVENALEYDREYEEERIEKIALACSDLSNFSLILNADDCSVVFDVSDSFLSLMKELDCPEDYLNLNRMYKDYAISIVSDVLRNAGYENFLFK